jgi:hypothetical protein
MTPSAMTRRVAGLALALCAVSAWANPHRLDDSQSYTVPPTAQMEWRPIPPGQSASGMEAWVRVNIRIATTEWKGRSGRVYMVLPRDQSSNIEAVWTTQGRLLPGRVVSGERTEVFVGVIPGDTLEDQMLVRLRSGADWQSASRRLNFHFEFDTD